MNKVKNIYTFGTSFTKGGGFEFWEKLHSKGDLLKRIYRGIGEKLTQENFSWPGQLKKLINDDNVNIINYAESGHGNERLYRKAYQVINSENFNVDTDVLFLEFSWLGRKEFFCNEINKSIILNYNISPEKELNENNGHGYRYFEDELNGIRIQNTKYIKWFDEYLSNHVDYTVQSNYMSNNLLLFLKYLTNKNIKFWFTQPPIGINYDYFHELKWDSRLIDFHKNTNGFMLEFAVSSEFSFDHAGSIRAETDSLVDDGHFGIISNKLVASKVYDVLVENELISNVNTLNLTGDYFNNIHKIIKENIRITKQIKKII